MGLARLANFKAEYCRFGNGLGILGIIGVLETHPSCVI